MGPPWRSYLLTHGNMSGCSTSYILLLTVTVWIIFKIRVKVRFIVKVRIRDGLVF